MEHLEDESLSLCEAVQISLEMEARGALPPEHRARLELHTAGCAECRSFRELVARTDRSLDELRQQVVAETRQSEASERLAKAQRAMRKQRWSPWIHVASMCLAVGVGLAIFGALSVTSAVGSLLMALPVLGVMLWNQRRFARLLAVSDGDVVATYRRALQHDVRTLTNRKPLYLLGAATALQVLVRLDSGFGPLDLMTFGGPLAVLVIILTHRYRTLPIVRRRLERMG